MYPPVIKVINGIYPWNIIKSVGLRLRAEKQSFTLDMLLTFPAIHSVIFLTPKRCLMRRCNAKMYMKFCFSHSGHKIYSKSTEFPNALTSTGYRHVHSLFSWLTVSVKNSKSAENILLINQANLASSVENSLLLTLITKQKKKKKRLKQVDKTRQFCDTLGYRKTYQRIKREMISWL